MGCRHLRLEYLRRQRSLGCLSMATPIQSGTMASAQASTWKQEGEVVAQPGVNDEGPMRDEAFESMANQIISDAAGPTSAPLPAKVASRGSKATNSPVASSSGSYYYDSGEGSSSGEDSRSEVTRHRRGPAKPTASPVDGEGKDDPPTPVVVPVVPPIMRPPSTPPPGLAAATPDGASMEVDSAPAPSKVASSGDPRVTFHIRFANVVDGSMSTRSCSTSRATIACWSARWCSSGLRGRRTRFGKC